VSLVAALGIALGALSVDDVRAHDSRWWALAAIGWSSRGFVHGLRPQVCGGLSVVHRFGWYDWIVGGLA
jgi:hypothetical protein